MKLYHTSAKALQMLPTAIRMQTYPLCQGLQVLHDLDPASSFLIMNQPHWPTFPQTQQYSKFIPTSQPLYLLILLLRVLLSLDTTASWLSAMTQIKCQCLWKVFLNNPSKSSAVPSLLPKKSFCVFSLFVPQNIYHYIEFLFTC